MTDTHIGMVPFEGRRVRGTIVVCHCGVTTTIPVNAFYGTEVDQKAQEQRFIHKRLEERGWKVGKTEAKHLCPSCKHRIAPAKVIDPELGAKIKQLIQPQEPAMSQPAVLTEGPEPTLTRDNRRIILVKLEEVYVDEKIGYSAGWTDGKVATDLGVPRAWVKSLREVNFGPEGVNEEITAAIKEANTVLTEIRKSQSRMEFLQKTSTDAIAEQKLISEQFRTIARRADKIELTIVDLNSKVRA